MCRMNERMNELMNKLMNEVIPIEPGSSTDNGCVQRANDQYSI